MPAGSEIILDWDRHYLPVQFESPIRLTVDGGWFNGVTRCIAKDGTSLNLGPEHWPHIWIIDPAPDAAGKE